MADKKEEITQGRAADLKEEVTHIVREIISLYSSDFFIDKTVDFHATFRFNPQTDTLDIFKFNLQEKKNGQTNNSTT